MKPEREAVVVIPRDGNKGLFPWIIHGHCKDHHAGGGGKLEPGETPIQAAVREMWEEVRLIIDPAGLVKFAEVHDIMRKRDGGHVYRYCVYFFWANIWSGVPTITEEADPTDAWFEISMKGMPWKTLFPSYPMIFTPLIESSRVKVTLTCLYNEDAPQEITETLFLPASDILEPKSRP